MEKDEIFTWQDTTLQATWKDVEAAYKIDQVDSNARLLPKVHDYHIMKAKVRKMKVSVAAQVFSQKYSAFMKLLIRLKCIFWASYPHIKY